MASASPVEYPASPNRSSYPSTTSEISRSLRSSSSSGGSSPSLTSSREAPDDAISQDSLTSSNFEAEFEKTTDDLQHDIDSALAEVMSGLQSLEMQQHGGEKPPQRKARKAPKPPPAHPKHTPDLVLDLPVTSDAPSSPKDHSDSDSESSNSSSSNLLSTAEVFANANQSTIKKGASMPRGSTIASGLPLVANKKRSASSSGTARPVTETEEGAMLRGVMTESMTETSSGLLSTSHTPSIMSSSFSGALPSAPSSRPPGPTKGPPMLVPRRSKQHPPETSTADTRTQKPAPAPEKSGVHERLLRPSPTPASREASPAPGGEKPALPDKPKPPLKTKPSVMKKPARSPEVLKRLKDRHSGGGDSSGSGSSSKEGSPEVWTPQPQPRLAPEVDPKT